MEILDAERLMLRSLNQADVERIEELAGDYDVAKTTMNIPHPYPEGSANDFIERSLLAEKNGEIHTYAIVKKKTDRLIGIIHINLTPAHERGELGYWIGKPYWGKGYGTEAARLIVSLGFEKLDLNKIYATAMESNPGSWRIMEKIGMTHEGTLKQHIFRWEQYFNWAFYGILKADYQKVKYKIGTGV